jgi:hypothetical protein
LQTTLFEILNLLSTSFNALAKLSVDKLSFSVSNDKLNGSLSNKGSISLNVKSLKKKRGDPWQQHTHIKSVTI